MDTRTKFTKFTFTLNNYTPEEETTIRAYAIAKAAFAVCGKEVGENGTPHLQGYMNLKAQTRFTAIKKLMPRAHIEIARGNDEQNNTYCGKDKDFWTVGEPQRAGKRNDLKVAAEKIIAGATAPAIALEHPTTYVKYYHGLERLIQQASKNRDRNDPPTTIWLWGKTGVGKTKFVYDNFPEAEIYSKDGSKWWDGYHQQQCILVDDFDGAWPFRDFLRFTDRYAYPGQTKGGYVKINSPFIIITCEHPPQHFWNENDLAQVLRRFQHIEELKLE